MSDSSDLFAGAADVNAGTNAASADIDNREAEAGRSQAELVRASQNGDITAWRQLIAIHAPRLAAYIGARLRRPEIVDKLVADSIYVAWKNIADLENEDDFPAWFRRMGGSVTMRWYKRHNDQGISGEFPVDRCQDADLGKHIEAVDLALGRLPEKERMALEQRFRAHLNNEEIAEVLHKDPEHVEELIQSGLLHLKKICDIATACDAD